MDKLTFIKNEKRERKKAEIKKKMQGGKRDTNTIREIERERKKRWRKERELEKDNKTANNQHNHSITI